MESWGTDLSYYEIGGFRALLDMGNGYNNDEGDGCGQGAGDGDGSSLGSGLGTGGCDGDHDGYGYGDGGGSGGSDGIGDDDGNGRSTVRFHASFLGLSPHVAKLLVLNTQELVFPETFDFIRKLQLCSSSEEYESIVAILELRRDTHGMETRVRPT